MDCISGKSSAVFFHIIIDSFVIHYHSSLGRLVAVGTDAVDDIVGGGRPIAFGQVDRRESQVGEAEGAVALFTIEMYMGVVTLLVTGAAAELIAHATLFTIDDVDDMMIAEER